MKHLRLFMIGALLLIGSNVFAQTLFKGSTEQYPTKDYSSSAIIFSLTEVAAALDIDAELLSGVLVNYIEADKPSPLFFVQQLDGTESSEPSANANGFWLSADGARVTWGNGCVFFAYPDVDIEKNILAFCVGQMPDVMKTGDKASVKIALKYNSKSVVFEIELDVIEKSYVLPEPELTISKLSIVDELTIDVEQKPRTSYEGDKVEVRLTEALTKLGIAGGLVQEELQQLLFATDCYLLDDAVLGVQKSDILNNQSTAGGIGFWMHNLNNTEESDATFECGRFSYDGDDAFYAETFAFDAETGILSCNIGQMPNRLKGGNTYYANIYIVYGSKAVKLRYNLIVLDVQLGTLDNYVKAGESTIKVEMEPQDNYEAKNFSIDIEAITAAIGSPVDDFYMIQDDKFAAKNCEGIGYWVDNAGAVEPWGTNSMFYITPKADDFSKFGIGQYPNHMSIGDSVRINLYFLANGKYYQQNIDFVIVASKTFESEFTIVAQRSIEIQQMPGEYVFTSGVEIPIKWVERQLGTSEWVLYALAPLNEDGSEKEGLDRYSKKYTCTPYPGFWMDGEGHNVGWSSNARVGVSIASPEGTFALMQYPGISLGEEFRFPLFLVNEDNGKMLEFDFTYKIVETVEETLPEPELALENLDIVGEMEIDVVQTHRGWYDGDRVGVDISKALEYLGLSNYQLVQNELAQILYSKRAYTDSISMTVTVSDMLTNEATAEEIGFWMRAVSGEGSEEIVECVCYPWGSEDNFYLENFVFDTVTGILYCNMGQYPNQLKDGKIYYAYLYLVYGSKAVKLRYNLIVPYVGTLDEYDKAGESTVTIEMGPKDSYETTDFTIDIESICEALGCAVGEIEDFYMLDNDGRFAGKNEIAGGYWLDKDGKVIKWDPSDATWEGVRDVIAAFYVTPKASDFSVLGIGQRPGHMKSGDSARTKLYFLANGMYYKLCIDLKITAVGRMGDVNTDGFVDVTDVVCIIDNILEKYSDNFDASLADVNGDNEIDVTDVVMVIDAILGKIELSRGSEMIDRSAYTAFQMDLTIPAGYVLESVSLTDIAKDSHSLAYNMLADGRCRVVVCSMNNEALPGAWDEVISLNLRGKGDAQVHIGRAVFVTIDGERHELMLNPTSIAEISNLKSQTSNIYDLQGRKFANGQQPTAKGLYIIDGKKAVRK